MDKDTIIEYIKKTPANTNPAVLGSMVDSVSGGGGGGGSSNTYRILADWNCEHTITVPPTDAVALPSGGEWQVDTNYQFDHYLVDGQGNALTADDIKSIKVNDVILEQPANEYYNDSYLKSTIAGILDYNGYDSDGNARCDHVIYYNHIMGSGRVAVGYAFVYEAPIESVDI